MDGNFVPNITFGPFIIKQIRKISKLHFETHLMISNPRLFFDEFIEAGSDTIIFHIEASDNPMRDLKYLRSKGICAGIALNPQTPAELIYNLLDYLDYILIMSVNPGFGGQSFIEDTIDKMETIVKVCQKRKIMIGVDGGINLVTIDKVYQTGIDVSVVGSALFKADNIKQRYFDLMNE